MSSFWIGPDESLIVGQVGFLVQFSNPNSGMDRIDMRDLPAHTNQSNEPRLYGWCGSWNDTSTNARGLASVERIARNGRAFVRHLHGDDLAVALDLLGYPELAPA